MGRVTSLKYNIVSKSKYVKASKNIRNKITYYKTTRSNIIKLPSKIHITKELKFRQFIDDDNMCVATAWCNAIACYVLKKTKEIFKPSQLYLHYFTRLLTENKSHIGCDSYDCINAIKQFGICSESEFSKNKVPSQNDILNGKQNIQNFEYLEIKNNLNCIKQHLCKLNTIIMSIDVYSSYDDFEDVLRMPDVNKETQLDGHCILLIGYDDIKKTFIYLDNDGFFEIEYDYILNKNLTSELYIITNV